MPYKSHLPHALIALPPLSMGIVCPTLAQSPVLEGQVSIHNSRHETGSTRYVQGARVSAAFFRGDTTPTWQRGCMTLMTHLYSKAKTGMFARTIH